MMIKMGKVALILILGQHHESNLNSKTDKQTNKQIKKQTKTVRTPKSIGKNSWVRVWECVDTASVNLHIAFECLSKICFSYKQ